MKLILISICLIILKTATSQNDPKWDDTKSSDWPSQCKKVEIISSVDKTIQPAYFFKASSESPRPLIISLHTWSGDYKQKDTLSWMCIENDYNYIHPNFRGSNNTKEACGSPLVIADINDAIDYAVKNGNVDTGEMHIIGASGGGYATLLSYMKVRHQIKTFSAWVPISNLVDWYYESVGRRQKYARDIAQATTGKKFKGNNYYFDEEEARKRSPFFMTTPVEQRKNSKLYIHTGIHDGYQGSVPVTQSLKFYNKVVSDFDPKAKESLISVEKMLKLVERRNTDILNPTLTNHGDILFSKQYLDKIHVNVFEGSHEMIPEKALEPVKAKKNTCRRRLKRCFGRGMGEPAQTNAFQ